MPTDQPVVHREAPEGLETKDTRGTLIGYSPSPVPHQDRTGANLEEDERRKADQHGDWQYGFSGVPEEDADNGGIVTASGGTQSKTVVSPSTDPGSQTTARGGGRGAKSGQ